MAETIFYPKPAMPWREQAPRPVPRQASDDHAPATRRVRVVRRVLVGVDGELLPIGAELELPRREVGGLLALGVIELIPEV